VNAIVARETEVVRAQLKRNGIAIHQGTAHFLDPHTVEVQDDGEPIRLEATKILIVCGNMLWAAKPMAIGFISKLLDWRQTRPAG
jgi:NAD(P) transhydrogenase